MPDPRTEIPCTVLPAAENHDPAEKVASRERELFELVIDLAPASRAAFLERACCGDAQLRLGIEELLAAADRAARNPAWNLPALHHEAFASAESLPPSGLDGYEILERIGAGGMGVVYRATRKDQQFSKVVALKIAHFSQPELMQRFYQERQIVGALDHPNIARLLDVGSTADGSPFLVMEFVDGTPVDRYVAAQRPSIRTLLGLFRKICGAVAHAHHNLIVHRDLKPANILVTPGGEPKLLDFGIAKLLDGASPRTLEGTSAMTPEYASPEQIEGSAITTASDIYSAGVLLYRILSGRLPYRHTESAAGLAHAIIVELPEPLTGVDTDLENIIQMSLRKEPARRYSSIEQFSEDIQRYLDGFPVLARPDTRLYRLAKFSARHRGVLIAAAGVLIALVGGIVTATRAQHRAERRFDQLRKLSHAVVFDYHDSIETLPGSTPVRRRLVKDALEYLDSLAAESPDSSLQRELIDSYVRISQDQGNSYYVNLGETAAALVSARKALTLGEDLLKRDSSVSVRQSVAAAFAGEGDLEYAVGQLDRAVSRYDRAVSLRESVMRDQPGNAENLTELATTLRHWGDLSGAGGMANLGRTADALRYYLRARDVAGKLVLLRPNEWAARKARYAAQFKLATIEITTGHLAEGDHDLHLALTMIEQIATGDRANTHDQAEIANTSGRLGVLNLSQARPRDATPWMEQSVTILEALQREDPEAVLFRHFLAVSQVHLAMALRLTGDPMRALPHNLTAVALSEALSTSGPKETEFLVDNASAHRDMAETLLALDQGPRAMEHAEKSVAVLTSMTGMPSDVSLPAALGTALRIYGDTQAKANLLADALESYSLSISKLEPLASRDPDNAVSQSDLAWSLARQGDCLARMGRRGASSAAYTRATLLWNGLRNRQALTAMDAARAHEVAMLGNPPRPPASGGAEP